MYYFPEPPYFLMSAGLLAGMASGVAFEATLKQAVQQWSKNRSTRTLANLQGLQLVIPFLGMAGRNLCIFSFGNGDFWLPKTTLLCASFAADATHGLASLDSVGQAFDRARTRRF